MDQNEKEKLVVKFYREHKRKQDHGTRSSQHKMAYDEWYSKEGDRENNRRRQELRQGGVKDEE